ncbi:MAG: phosphonate ABC transporter, permease protein PhnE [Spirochaetia bacterium]|nr:phosphonate ABC transporter, permease protein PhnE [Spirochaetia bacterium]
MKNTITLLLSFLFPGAGHLYRKHIQRGLLIILSFTSILGLSISRISLLAHRHEGFLPVLKKAFSNNPGFIIFLIVLTLLLWVWIAIDSVKYNLKKKRPGVFIIILVIFFGLGWQISEIDIVKAAVQMPAAWKPLSKVLWPWKAAITYKTEELTAGADLVIDEPDYILPEHSWSEGKPFVETNPRWGSLSTLDMNNEIVKGTDITVKGKGFTPGLEGEVWWLDSIQNEFRPREGGKYLAVIPDDEGKFEFTMTLPYRLIPPSAEGVQINRVEIRQVSRIGGPIPADPLKLTITRMVETIFMGMMATIFGIILSIPVSFLAARNIMSGSWITVAVYYFVRTILNIVRSIEPLIWALIAVVWVGLGPFAGILALTIHSVAALGKLYSEGIENIDPGPIEAIKATGANTIQTIMFAIIPQMIPPFVSFSIYRWDINVRMSTVIGLVGGGGIGFLLVQYIRLLDYHAAGIAVWFIAVTVAILDYVSAEIRRKFI